MDRRRLHIPDDARRHLDVTHCGRPYRACRIASLDPGGRLIELPSSCCKSCLKGYRRAEYLATVYADLQARTNAILGKAPPS